MEKSQWAGYFRDFPFPYGFYGPEEYRGWLSEAGLKAESVKLVPKDRAHQGLEGLERFIGSTWLPYTGRLPEDLRPLFIRKVAQRYLEQHPPKQGQVHLRMVRLQVAAERAD